MKTIYLIFLFISTSFAFSQTSHLSSWTGSVQDTTWQSITLYDIDVGDVHLDIYNGGSSGNLLVSLTVTDTAGAVNGKSKYAIVIPSAVFTVHTLNSKIWLKSSSGTLSGVILERY